MANQKTVKKVLAGIIALIVAGAVVYGAQLGNKPAGSGSKEDGLYPIKTWSKTDCASTPWIVADQKGFFAAEGLKIIYTGDTQPAQQLPSVLNGNNDVGSAHPNTLTVAIAGGAKIKGVVKNGIDPTPEQNPRLRHMFWYVNPAVMPNVHSFADLNKLSGQLKFSTITNNICADFLGNNIADKQSLSRERIEWVSMPDVQAIQALKQGLIAVAGVHPPYYKGMEEAGAVKIADSLDAGVGVAGGLGFYYFTNEFIDTHPDVIKKFARAISKAQTWANDNPEESRKMTEDWIKVPVNAVHYYANDTKIIESEIEPWIKDLEDSNVIPKGKIKAADIITHAFE